MGTASTYFSRHQSRSLTSEPSVAMVCPTWQVADSAVETGHELRRTSFDEVSENSDMPLEGRVDVV